MQSRCHVNNANKLQDFVRPYLSVPCFNSLTSLPAIILTTWHLAFASLMTQILARTTTLLDSRKTVKMTGRIYLRAIVPIGFFFSLSLICGNKAYLYLSVAFIQMLKVKSSYNIVKICSIAYHMKGHYARRSSSCYLVPGSCSTELENAGKCLIHCDWCHPCLFRRDHVRLDWFHISSHWRYV